MSTVKISELALITQLDANTSNSLFMGVDIPSGVTGKFTAHTLAQSLYSNEVLNVGANPVVFPNVAAQFSGNGTSFLQVNLQNFDGNGSGDIVITADNGTNETNFIDMGINGSTYDVGVYSALKKNDGYLVVVGNEGSPGGNLTLGTGTSNTRINFINSGLELDNIVGYIDQTGAYFTNIDTEISANLATAKAYTDTANTFLKGVSNTQNTRIDAAFTKANNALANTTGTFAGDLTITGNTHAAAMNTNNLSVVGTANVSGTLNVVGAVSMNATLVLANSNFQATEAAVTISASPTVATPANDGYMIHISGKNGVPSRVVSDSYGTGAYSLFAARTARGNVAYPSAVQTGDVIGRFSAGGYGTTKFQALGTGRIDFIAAENFTDANTGSQITFWNCPVGSNTLVNILTLNGLSAVFTGVVNPQKGFIFTPRLPVGAQTAISIDYSNDSIIKANCAADVTVSHTNFTSGKVIELWLTNTDSQNHTITHGIAALRSTNKSTTATITAGSSLYMKFFSIDGDLANTFVTIIG